MTPPVRTPMPWVKLHTRLLDDPEFACLPVRARARYYDLLMLAGRCDAGGAFIIDERQLSVKTIAWFLHASDVVGDLERDLEVLKERGYLELNGRGWQLISFEGDQGPDGFYGNKCAEWKTRQDRSRGKGPAVTSDTSVTPPTVTSDTAETSSVKSKSKSQESESDKSQSQESEESQSVSDPAPQPTDDDRSQTDQKRLICSHAGILPVYAKKIITNPNVTGDDILAELSRNIARKGEGKGRVRNPGQCTGLNLSKYPPEKPAAEWYDQARWLIHLPGALKTKLGLAFQSDENTEDTSLGVATRISIKPDESVDKSLDGHMSPAQAWQSALGQLQMEMPKGSFDTWVRDAAPIRYDDGLLTVGVRSAATRDWLESRLTSTLTRLLMGIMNRTVDLNFTVQEDVPA